MYLLDDSHNTIIVALIELVGTLVAALIYGFKLLLRRVLTMEKKQQRIDRTISSQMTQIYSEEDEDYHQGERQ